jgi:pilus assembly protein Flp/PilA
VTNRFLRDQRGATAIEYALIASLIFLAIVASVIPVGTALSGVFGDVAAGF